MNTHTRPLPKKQFDDSPLWSHVDIIAIPINGGGNRKWSCKYCGKVVTGSYSKVKAHLLQISNVGVGGCKKLADDVLAQITSEHEEAERKSDDKRRNSMQAQQYLKNSEGSDLVQPKKRKGALEMSFNVIERDELDKECALMFYTAALPFNLARNPYFRSYSKKLANGKVAGYVPPTYNRLRTTLLSQQKQHVDKLLQPIRDSWIKKGSSICSDGWSDRQSRPLINMMVASAAGPMFLKAIDSGDNTKDAEYIAQLFFGVIDEVGAENVVQVVTDNAANFKAAGALIEGKHPHIFWTPCVVHCLNLVIKAFCEPTEKSPHYTDCLWVKELVSQVREINYFILNHTLSRTIFNRHSHVKLLKVAETRFASHIVMATRLCKVREALVNTVIDADWKKFRVNGRTPVELKAREIKDVLLSDTWWDKLEYLLNFTEPMMKFLRIADKDSSVLHLVYDMWDTMIEDVKGRIFEHEGLALEGGKSAFFDMIQQVIENRWNKSNTSLHCLAHSLVPMYYRREWLEGGSNGIRRVAPNEDEEISLNRDSCFHRLFQNSEELKRVYKEYGAFSCGLDYFGQAHVIAARSYEDPLSWWANYGSFTPLLQTLAFRLLSQPASSSCCERNWSTYGAIQTVKRNKLTTQRAEDLVFVHNNLRLLSRKNEEYMSGPSKFWDIGGDNIEGDSILEVADLSLNDPELEAMTFEE